MRLNDMPATLVADDIQNRCTSEDFARAVEALRKANIPGPWIIYYKGEENVIREDD